MKFFVWIAFSLVVLMVLPSFVVADGDESSGESSTESSGESSGESSSGPSRSRSSGGRSRSGSSGGLSRSGSLGGRSRSGSSGGLSRSGSLGGRSRSGSSGGLSRSGSLGGRSRSGSSGGLSRSGSSGGLSRSGSSGGLSRSGSSGGLSRSRSVGAAGNQPKRGPVRNAANAVGNRVNQGATRLRERVLGTCRPIVNGQGISCPSRQAAVSSKGSYLNFAQSARNSQPVIPVEGCSPLTVIGQIFENNADAQGKTADTTSVLITADKQNKILFISYRGSTGSIAGADWRNNFHASQQKMPLFPWLQSPTVKMPQTRQWRALTANWAGVKTFPSFTRKVLRVEAPVTGYINKYSDEGYRKFIFTGHSQGAGMANIAYVYFKVKSMFLGGSGLQFGLVTFASPKVGNEGFAALAEKLTPGSFGMQAFATSTARCSLDPVSIIPPPVGNNRFGNYVHWGKALTPTRLLCEHPDITNFACHKMDVYAKGVGVRLNQNGRINYQWSIPVGKLGAKIGQNDNSDQCSESVTVKALPTGYAKSATLAVRYQALSEQTVNIRLQCPEVDETPSQGNDDVDDYASQSNQDRIIAPPPKNRGGFLNRITNRERKFDI